MTDFAYSLTGPAPENVAAGAQANQRLLPTRTVYNKVNLPSVQFVRQRREMRGPNDDWSGIGDPVKRRKIQNRLHQRAWRRRQITKKTFGTLAKDTDSPSQLAQRDIQQIISTSPDTSEPLLSLLVCDEGDCGVVTDKMQRSLTKFTDHVRAQILEGSPRTDMLLTLIKFNIFRALMMNNQMLGFANQWLQCDTISPFSLQNDRQQAAVHTYPPSLTPTNLQLLVTHHPWIDLLPDPRMRNNILLLGNDYDDEPLCHDIVDNRHGQQSESLIVWGDAHNPENWEIGEGFYKKWHTVMEGCHQLFRATNSWRLKRGEPKLFPDFLGIF